jgi:FKBP-type peptidyl-prolyl cis-trans isomerase FkpA
VPTAVKDKQLQMRQTIFTLLLFLAIGLISCRKNGVDLNIKQYDQAQIENYIAAHALTGMIRDTSGGDTTGMYYKILQPGAGPALNYPDSIAFVFTLRSFDGTYVSADTIANHYDSFVGHIYADHLPIGLQLAVHNILKYRGASMRLLIPSHLAYGIGGYGSGSSQVANNKIPGNASLDYYVHAIGNSKTDNQATYDNTVIQNYMHANNLSGYTETASGLYYKVLTPGTGTDPITINSTITSNYTGSLFNGTLFDSLYNGTNYATSYLVNFQGTEEGLFEGLQLATVGTKISFLIPSGLAFGNYPNNSLSIPPFSCLRYTWIVLTVTP